MSTITETISPAADIASVKFSNPGATIGVQRTDTNVSVVAAGTALTESPTGVWSYTFADPAPGLPYSYWIQVTTTAGAIIRFERQMYSLWSSPGSVFGQTDALALAVVDWLVANSGSFILPITPQRRFNLLDELPNVPAYNEPVDIDVFADGESSERQGVSTAFTSIYSIHLVLRQQVSGAANEDTQCSLLTALRSQIIEGLKLRAFSLTNAVHPVNRVFLVQPKSTDMRLYDLKLLKDAHTFMSDTILTFRAAA